MLVIGAAGCGGRASEDSGPPATPTTVAPSPDRAPTELHPAPQRSLIFGSQHSCRVDAEHALWCWGENYQGQLGVGTAGHGKLGDERTRPTRVPGLTNVVRGDASAHHTCVVTDDHRVQCFGFNGEGELGQGAATGLEQDPADYSPRVVQGFDDVVDVGTGNGFTCVLAKSGKTHCWGTNSAGQLGAGFSSLTDSLQPELVLGVEAKALVAGWDHTCAVQSSGKLVCWGTGDELGAGVAVESSALPLDVKLGAVRFAASGVNHVCAVTEDGALWCWGWGADGQLGVDTEPDTTLTTPVMLPLTGVTQLALGFQHSCALDAAGAVRCFGQNSRGQLGVGAQLQKSAKALPVSLPEPALELAAGWDHTCALGVSGRLYCWGANDRGQLGIGTMSEGEAIPLEVLFE